MVNPACMRFQDHLPSRFKDRRRPLALPVGNVEFAACPVHGNHTGHEESLLVPIAASHRYVSIIDASETGSRRSTMMLSMAIRILTLTLLLTAMLVSEERMFQPRFSDGNQLVRPEGYREWMFVGSNLNMGYSEGGEPKESRFHNIYIQREAYREYAATGKFPDKTMLVMEVIAAGTNASINKKGQFADKSVGIEVALKDEKRFAEKWAYFNFIGKDGAALPEAKAFAKEACWKCHNEHGAADNVFVQFYPALREARPKP
jgi:hypothetical protein